MARARVCIFSPSISSQSLIRGSVLRQETQIGLKNDAEGSGELSDLTRKDLVSVLTEIDNT